MVANVKINSAPVIVEEYAPAHEKRTKSAAEKMAESILNSSFSRNHSSDFAPDANVETLPDMESIKRAFRDPSTAELSRSLGELSLCDWSPEDAAANLMLKEEIRERFEDVEKLTKILRDLKQLNIHLKDLGCQNLEDFLALLFDDLSGSWVIIPEERNNLSQHHSLKELFLTAYRYTKKLSEIKGALGTITTVIWLVSDPKAKVIIKGLSYIAKIFR